LVTIGEADAACAGQILRLDLTALAVAAAAAASAASAASAATACAHAGYVRFVELHFSGIESWHLMIKNQVSMTQF
jgi:hypothetical protein